MIPFSESRFFKSDCPAAESRFPNPTVRAGSAGELKRHVRQTNARTHAQTD
jgi:hypothetical protein